MESFWASKLNSTGILFDLRMKSFWPVKIILLGFLMELFLASERNHFGLRRWILLDLRTLWAESFWASKWIFWASEWNFVGLSNRTHVSLRAENFWTSENIFWTSEWNIFCLPNGIFCAFESESFWAPEKNSFGLPTAIFWASKLNSFGTSNGILLRFQTESSLTSDWNYFRFLNVIIRKKIFWASVWNCFLLLYGFVLGFLNHFRFWATNPNTFGLPIRILLRLRTEFFVLSIRNPIILGFWKELFYILERNPAGLPIDILVALWMKSFWTSEKALKKNFFWASEPNHCGI